MRSLRWFPHIAISSLILIIFLGIFVRYIDLGDHFAHIDDIGVAFYINQESQVYTKKNFPFFYSLLQERLHNNQITGLDAILIKVFDRLGILENIYQIIYRFKPHVIVGKYWTYAPFQFYITPFFLDYNQSYREQLFWGRFPSFLFSILSLFLIPFLFWSDKNHKTKFLASVFLTVVMIGFSWENIIYAKQMECYSIGVLSAILTILVLDRYLQLPNLGFWPMLILGLILGVLSYTQYQILFFIPPFYGTLFLYFFFKKRKKFRSLLLPFTLSGGVFISLFVPLYVYYLKLMAERDHTQTWSSGGGYFAFDFPWNTSLTDQLYYPIKFFFKNFYLAFELNRLFAPEDFWPGKIVIIFLLVCFALGCLSYAKSQDLQRKFRGIFFLGIAVIFSFLIVTKKVTFGSTRHVLIFLPYMVLLIVEGFLYFCDVVSSCFKFDDVKKWKLLSISTAAISSCIIILFFCFFQQTVEERKDPFEESELVQLFEKYQVQAVLQQPNTINLSLMNKLNKKFPVLISAWGLWSIDEPIHSYDTIAYVGHRQPLDNGEFQNIMISALNSERASFNIRKFNNYRMVFKKESFSNVEVDYVKSTKNGSNGYFLYILKYIQAQDGLSQN